MPTPKSEPRQENAMDLLYRAITAFDTQIADLQAKRAQLIALTGQAVTMTAAPTTAAPKSRGMSDEAKAKISAAAKKRWAKHIKAAKAAQKAETETTAAPAPAKASTKKTVLKGEPKKAAKPKKGATANKAQAAAEKA
jgi:hypothetical protein